MKTIQMTIGEPLLKEVDRAVRAHRTTRSAFIRAALQAALRRHDIRNKDQLDEAGYSAKPDDPDELTS